jgi:hypothetical protein
LNREQKLENESKTTTSADDLKGPISSLCICFAERIRWWAHKGSNLGPAD